MSDSDWYRLRTKNWKWRKLNWQYCMTDWHNIWKSCLIVKMFKKKVVEMLIYVLFLYTFDLLTFIFSLIHQVPLLLYIYTCKCNWDYEKVFQSIHLNNYRVNDSDRSIHITCGSLCIWTSVTSISQSPHLLELKLHYSHASIYSHIMNIYC